MGQKKKNTRHHTAGDQKLHQAIVALEHTSKRALSSLDRSCEALSQLEGELEGFLSDYYDKVGGYFEQLAELERELEALDAGPAASMPMARRIYREQEVLPEQQNRSFELGVRAMYRDMVRECHPDSQPNADRVNDETIKTLNDAYSRRNLGDLWRIRFDLEEQKAGGTIEPQKRMELLKQRVQQMQSALDAVEQRRAQLEESPACALMQRAFQMKLCGQNFVEMVLEDVQRQIERRRRDLVEAKLRHLYSEARMVRESRRHSHAS